MPLGQRPPDFGKTVLFLAKVLASHQYAFRGTASLVLQGLDMNVADIDILADKETALACNNLLKEFLVSPVAYSESGKFRSYFGQFKVNNLPLNPAKGDGAPHLRRRRANILRWWWPGSGCG